MNLNSILKDFTKLTTKLKKFEQQCQESISYEGRKIEEARSRQLALVSERDRANKISSNLKSLLEVE